MKIVDIIVWILFIISIFVFFWYVLGNSPSIEQTFLVLIISYLFVMNAKLVQIATRLQMLQNSFRYLARDFKEHIKHKYRDF